jgi:hypothetical protein
MATEIIEVFNAPTDVVEVLVAGPIGPQANINYTVVSSSQAVSNRQLIAANTLAGSFTLTLPSNPAAGDAIDIFDYSDTFDTNPLTIGRNGKNIEGEAEDLVANVEGAYFTLIFTGDSRGWQVVPRYGVAGVSTVSGTAPIVSSGGTTPTLSITAATTSAAGSMSSADKTKLDGIATGAEVNVNADWDAVSGDAQILNKPATFTPSSHTHGSITNDGKVGAVSGLPVVTTTDGAVTTLALGTANQVLRVNSGETGVEFGAGFDAASPPQIGSTTPNSAAFTSLSANNGTLTASAPVLDLSQTWNNAGVTFTGLNLALTNTASASASAYLSLGLNGTQIFSIRRGGANASATVITGGGPGLVWTARTRTGAGVGVNFSGVVGVGTNLQFGTGTGTTGGDLVLLRDDAANVLALRRTTNPQTFRLYGTFTTATNYQRMTVRSVKQTLSALSGASATTTGTLIPDGAVVVGVTTQVATAITGATGYQVGDGTDADRWGDINAIALNTTSDNANWTAGTIECFTAGGEVTLTANGSNFTAGAVEICVFYLAGEAD